MGLLDYNNLKFFNEGSDADWKKALAESQLIAKGQQVLKPSAYTPTERIITNPLSSGLEFLNVDPRFASACLPTLILAGLTCLQPPLQGKWHV